MDHIEGLIAAVFTPFDAVGNLNLSVVEAQAERLAADGAAGAFVAGSSGEGLSLTVAERKRLAERWCEAVGERLAVIIHVGAECLADAQSLAAHAAECGARAVAAVPPVYYKPQSVDALAEWCARLAPAAADLPFYYYHIPRMTGVELPMGELLPAAGQRAPNLAGVKYSHADLADAARCAALDGGRFDVLFGLDEMLLSALSAGCRGAVGTTYNFAAPLYRRILDAFGRGDLEAARADQRRAVEMIALLHRYGFYAASKAVSKMAGVDCGAVRPPLTPLTDAQADELRGGLERLGFFE
jgi:N-acetylneuraminate lyase